VAGVDRNAQSRERPSFWSGLEFADGTPIAGRRFPGVGGGEPDGLTSRLKIGVNGHSLVCDRAVPVVTEHVDLAEGLLELRAGEDAVVSLQDRPVWFLSQVGEPRVGKEAGGLVAIPRNDEDHHETESKNCPGDEERR
jgi:hypothetical protein